MTLSTMTPNSPTTETINWTSFNMQQDCATVATDQGIRVFNLNPLSEALHLTQEQVGSVRIAHLLHRSNLIALVSGGARPKYAENTLMLWDDKKKACVFECAIYGGPILNVFMNSSRLVLVQAKRIHIFGLQPFVTLRAEETGVNLAGIAAMGGESYSAVLAFPSFKQGSVQLVALENVTSEKSLAPTVVAAHQGDIAALAVSSQGTLLATGSAKGTLIRIFDTRTRTMLNELRRGFDPSTLHCLTFSPCGTFVAVSSDKATVHIFRTREKQEWNRKNIYDDSVRNMSKFQVPADTIAKLAFVQEESDGEASTNQINMSVVAITSNGQYRRFSFNKDGHSECKAFDYILQLGSEQDFWLSAV